MSAARIALLAASLFTALAGDAMANSVVVAMDNVTMVAFRRPVSTVYVGNPSIANVTMIDSRHVFVLGKRFGATNLIALGANDSVVANDLVTVSGRHAGAVTVYRGSESYNYSCTSAHCETRPMPGDPKNYFDNTETAAAAHEDTGIKAAGAAMQTEH